MEARGHWHACYESDISDLSGYGKPVSSGTLGASEYILPRHQLLWTPAPSLGQALCICLSCPTSTQTPALESWLGRLAIFDLGDVPDHNLSHRDLDHLSSPDYGELLLLLDTALQAPELFFLTPVIEGCDQDHTDD